MKVKLSGVKKVPITSDFIRLDALLKFVCVAGTGGEAKLFIQSGDVTVGGQPCTQRGKKLRDGDTVRFGGETYIIKGGNPA